MESFVTIGFVGKATEAIKYYKEVFHMKQVFKPIKYQDIPKKHLDSIKGMEMSMMAKDQIMFSLFSIGNTTCMIFDFYLPSTSSTPTTPFFGMGISVKKAKEVDRLHNLLLKDGGYSMVAPCDAFWGARFALIMDKFGIKWSLTFDKSQ